MKLWVDVKIDLMLETLRNRPSFSDVQLIIADIQSAFDSARSYPIDDPELYRARCNKLLTCAKIAEKRTFGRELAYVEALEGVLIGVLSGRVKV